MNTVRFLGSQAQPGYEYLVVGLERQGALGKSAMYLTEWDIWCPSGYEGSNPSPYTLSCSKITAHYMKRGICQRQITSENTFSLSLSLHFILF